MPPIFEERVAWREEWAESQPEPDRSRFLKICAYDRAEEAYTDRYTQPDADPEICSMYLDIMMDAVKWKGITDRYWRLLPILRLRREFRDYQRKKRLSWRSGFLPLLYAILIGPLRDGQPYMSASELERVRQLTKTPESEERLERARRRASTPSVYNPPPLSPEEIQRLAVIPEHERNYHAYTAAELAARLSQEDGNEKECEKQLDIMVQAIPNFEDRLFYRALWLLDVWMLRVGFRIKHPKKRLKGRSRWFYLVVELVSSSWRTPEQIRNLSKRTEA
jgi:hypothetical protein